MTPEAMKPEIKLFDEMIERAARVLDRSYDRHEMTLQQVAREVLEAAFDGVPATNYGIGLALQFFDLVICVKDLESRPAAGVYRVEGDPDGFDSLGHGIDVSYGQENGVRWIKRIAISALPAPASNTKEPK